MLYYVGIVLMIVGVIAFFMGKKGAAGLTEERGQMLLAVGVILGIILVIVSYMMG